jgi:SAM-dependent methyltransferase
MPTLRENKATWDGSYRWTHRGDEWSAAWGGPAMQWHGAILPRIHAFLPAPAIVEIACGYGRWTQFLQAQCAQLAVVDLSEECIAACRRRFVERDHIAYHVNDGRSLDMLADQSADFVFSFDSLVHADAGVLESYVTQLRRILKPDGAAFLHHSNLGEYPYYAAVGRIPKLQAVLSRAGILERDVHWRDPGVTAAQVAAFAAAAGLQCIVQERITWGTRRALIDCMSTIVRRDSKHAGAARVLRNPDFMREAAGLARLAAHYAAERR